MTPGQKELLRLALLRVLDQNRSSRHGFGIPALQMLTLEYCGKQSLEVLQEQVEYLQSKGLVVEVEKVISRENRTWKITSEGIAYVDEHNLSGM